MSRLFGRSKPKEPAPSLTDMVASTDGRVESVEKKVQKLDQQLNKYKQQMKTMRDGPAKTRIKKQALQIYKQKLHYEKQMGNLQQQSFNMEQQNYALQSLKDTQHTVAAMKTGAKAMKKEFKKIDVGDVEDLQYELEDLMMDHDEIQEIMGQSYGMDDVDEDDLEAEFDALDFDLEGETEGLSFLDDAADVPSTVPAQEQPSDNNVAVDEFGLPMG